MTSSRVHVLLAMAMVVVVTAGVAVKNSINPGWPVGRKHGYPGLVLSLAIGAAFGAVTAAIWLLVRWRKQPPFPRLDRKDFDVALLSACAAFVAAVLVSVMLNITEMLRASSR